MPLYFPFSTLFILKFIFSVTNVNIITIDSTAKPVELNSEPSFLSSIKKRVVQRRAAIAPLTFVE